MADRLASDREDQLSLWSGAEHRVGFRGPTVCKIVGITYRQLDYWARTGLVVPSVRQARGSGSQRLYSFDDLVELRVIKRLLDTGVSLQRVREAVEELRSRGQTPADVTLLSDGSTVYALDDNQQVIDLLARGQGVFAIALGPVVEELRGEVTRFPVEEVDAVRPADDPRDQGSADVRAVR
ncbi:MAG: MerR family transcriptional regulator [Actinobacteria bacterium]|nr:MerR family transcriptional regulator [Actinomycetota bacterium]